MWSWAPLSKCSLTLKALVASGKLKNDCSDLRAAYQQAPNSSSVAVDHSVTFDSSLNCANSSRTLITFPLMAGIDNMAQSQQYFLYYSYPQASVLINANAGFHIVGA